MALYIAPLRWLIVIWHQQDVLLINQYSAEGLVSNSTQIVHSTMIPILCRKHSQVKRVWLDFYNKVKNKIRSFLTRMLAQSLNLSDVITWTWLPVTHYLMHLNQVFSRKLAVRVCNIWAHLLTGAFIWTIVFHLSPQFLAWMDLVSQILHNVKRAATSAKRCKDVFHR